MKKRIGLGLDEDLLKRVDEARGDVSRTRFIERALEARLGPPQDIAGLIGAAAADPETGEPIRTGETDVPAGALPVVDLGVVGGSLGGDPGPEHFPFD